MTAARSLHGRLVALEAVVRAEAAAAEPARGMTPALLDALVREGLLRLWNPRALGGPELPLPETLDLFEEASRLDGSFGWLVTIGTGGGLLLARMEPGLGRQIAGPPEGVIAGSGTPSGRAIAVTGGYRVSGRWRYCSGAQYATWFTMNCVVHDGGVPRTDPEGSPLVRAVAVPRGAVRVDETWDALGLRATSSHDVVVDGVFVAARQTFDALAELPPAGPLYRFPFLAAAELSFAAVPLGIAADGIAAFAAMAREKPLLQGGVLGDTPAARLRLAEATATLAAARAAFHATARQAWEAVVAGATLSGEEQRAVTAASVAAAQAAVRSLDLLYAVAGVPAALTGSAFGRCWRDAHTVVQHALLSPLRVE